MLFLYICSSLSHKEIVLNHCFMTIYTASSVLLFGTFSLFLFEIACKDLFIVFKNLSQRSTLNLQ